MREEIYIADNPDEIVWLRLNRLKSVSLCEKLIRNKLKESPNSLITDDLIQAKAVGLSSAIESAIGYWQSDAMALNAKVLSRYYFLLQMTIAEQVGSVYNTDNLSTVQKHTTYGHGLGTVTENSDDFPENYFSFCMRAGHFSSYLKSLKIDTKDFDFERRPKALPNSESEKNRMISIRDLFRRIPELRDVIEEYTGEAPLSIHVGYSETNTIRDSERTKQYIQETGQFTLSAPRPIGDMETIVSIYSDSLLVTTDYIKSLGFPFKEVFYEEDVHLKRQRVAASVIHSSEIYWWQHLQTYSSSYSSTSIVVPLWGKISDTVLINYILLYSLSIIVRYMPDLWYRIQKGDLNHYGSLIEYYISLMDHVLPLQMMERIEGKKISVHQPGSMFAPM